jgi:RNA polymerase sigma-70 factor (ECF subfamily)
VFDHERDLQLAVRMSQGDEEAFTLIYEQYAKPLKSYFFRACYDDREAEDLVQETFLRLWRARERYRPEGRFSTYLFQIAKNLWINRRQRLLRNPVRVSLTRHGDEAGVPEAPAPLEASDPGEQVHQAEMLEVLREAIHALPEKHRDVLLLGRIEGLRYRDIAEILDIPVGTVKSRMAAAEEKLRGRMMKYLCMQEDLP